MSEHKPLERKIITTEDGSHTLFIASLNEHYHSIHGAIQESEHVFIKSGFDLFDHCKPLKILEVGFGTGLNTFLTWQHNQQKLRIIEYTSIEKYPLTQSEYMELNFAEQINPNAAKLFLQMHKCPWNEKSSLDAYFVLNKLEVDLLLFNPESTFDLIYFDAFAPDIQPDLWTEQVFQKLFKHMNPKGILCTYSAKGQVRRNLIAAGFKVKRLPGPPGKREMLQAEKPE
jgi:tRNA U34 5-methylaminomethyl-2-thiouridine-forming methyltransferase MnmC